MNQTTGPIYEVQGDKASNRKTFRIRQICARYGEEELQDVLLRVLACDKTIHNLKIRSLARSLISDTLSSDDDGGKKEATIEFDRCPEVLEDGMDEWKFPGEIYNLPCDIIIDSHFQGITVLSDIAEGEFEFDCIAITGLAGHGFGSWKNRGRDTSFMWLRDRLPKALKGVRSMIYSDDTHLVGSESFQQAGDLGIRLSGLLKDRGFDRPSSSSSRPLIFVAHSLGGIILKEALLHQYNQSKNFSHILGRIKKIIFFGVPHLGMEIGHLQMMIKGQPNEPLTYYLRRDNPELHDLNDSFSDLCEEMRIRVISFYETKRTSTPKQREDKKWQSSGGPYRMLVDKHSAIHRLSAKADTYPINMDHSNMVKFTDGSNDLDRVIYYMKDTQPPLPSKAIEYCSQVKFIGRTDELINLEDLLQPFNPNLVAAHILVISGAGGIGKTALARQYRDQNMELFTDGSLELDATTEKTFVKSVSDKCIGTFSELSQDIEKISYDNLKKKFWHWFNFPGRTKWLLIINNCHDFTGEGSLDISDFLHGFTQGHIIITTRRRNEFVGMPKLRLGKLDRDSSNNLLHSHLEVKRAYNQKEQNAVDELLGLLDGIPLAINYAGSYLDSLQVRPTEYVQFFREKLAMDSHPENITLTLDHSHGSAAIQASWALSYAGIQMISPTAASTLRHWCILADKNFGFDLISHYDTVGGTDQYLKALVTRPGKKHCFREAMRVLMDFSFVERDDPGHSIIFSIPETYSMHCITHSRCRTNLWSSAAMWAALGCLSYAIPERGEPRFWEETLGLVPHAEKVWTSVHEFGTGHELSGVADTPKKIEYMIQMSMLFRTRQDPSRARMCLNMGQKLYKLLAGSSARDEKLEIYLTEALANLQKSLGNHQKALKGFKRVYCVSRNLYGEADERTAGAASNLGSALTKTHQYEEASKTLRKSLQIFESLDQSPSVRKSSIECRERLVSLRLKTKPLTLRVIRKVIVELESIMRMSEALYAPMSDKVARAAVNLAKWYFHNEQYEESAMIYEKYLPVLEETRPRSSDVLDAKEIHGRLYFHIGKYEEARKLLEEARRELQNSDIRFLYVTGYLGDVFWAQGRYDRAEDCYTHAAKVHSETWLQVKMGQTKILSSPAPWALTILPLIAAFLLHQTLPR